MDIFERAPLLGGKIADSCSMDRCLMFHTINKSNRFFRTKKQYTPNFTLSRQYFAIAQRYLISTRSNLPRFTCSFGAANSVRVPRYSDTVPDYRDPAIKEAFWQDEAYNKAYQYKPRDL